MNHQPGVSGLALILISLFVGTSLLASGQSSPTNRLKAELEKSADPVGYLKSRKKKYKIDTVSITSNKKFLAFSDSIAYHGKLKKVYGPIGDDSVLLQVIGKAPNIFYRAGHVLLDTPKLNTAVVRKLADTLIARIKRKESTLEDFARIYNTDGSGPSGGDLGWRARGTLLPVMENAILKKKKGDIIKIWSPYGLHIIQVTGTPVQDVGFALLLRVNAK